MFSRILTEPFAPRMQTVGSVEVLKVECKAELLMIRFISYETSFYSMKQTTCLLLILIFPFQIKLRVV